MARRSVVGWVVALALLCSGCAIDATVTVTVRDDGSGVVRADLRADPEAVQTAEVGGGRLEDRVRLSDLAGAGWRVGPWVRHPDGSASLTLRKPFGSVDEVPGILRELSGESGPLRDAEVTRSRGFLATDYGARVTADLSTVGTGILADPELAASLSAQGLDVGAADQALLTQLRDAVTLRLVVELPGGTREVLELPKEQAATLQATSSVRDTRRVALLVAAGILVLLAIAVAIWPSRRGRRRRARSTVRVSGGSGPTAPLTWEQATSPTRWRTPPGS